MSLIPIIIANFGNRMWQTGRKHQKIHKYMERAKRIPWIDWAKVWGIMIVVFCHVPQYDTVVKQFLAQVQMPLFFMLSGYLHKPQPSLRDALPRYWKSLIVPYLLFQVLFYPYWLVKEVLIPGTPFDVWHSLVMPFLGCLVGNVLDGPTWFLPALLVLKLLADVSLSSRYSRLLMPAWGMCFIVTSFFIWRDEVVNLSFTWDSLTNYAPFFLLGIYLRKECGSRWASRLLPSKGASFSCSVYFLLTLLCVLTDVECYGLERLRFYATGVSGAFFVLQFCKMLPDVPSLVTDLSKGTIIILGFHWMCIGSVNFVLERYLLSDIGILYSTSQALLLVLFITFINYLAILFLRKHFRILLGGR